jgi:lysophospholipase L1-like esterase
MSWKRRTGRAVAYGGGGAVGVSAGMIALLAAEARLARRFIGTPDEEPPMVEGWWTADGRHASDVPPDLSDQEPLRLAILGDSSAAGFGADLPEQAPGGALALALASATGRTVMVRSAAFVGAQSSHLAAQADHVLDVGSAGPPDLAVIIIGANDVTHGVRPQDAAAALGAVLERFAAQGIDTVVGTCPDLGTIRPIPHPLRLVCRHWSRSLARHQGEVAQAHGVRAVAMGHLLGPEFAANPHEMFGPDRFHPSAAGYAAAARALLPALLDAARERGITVGPDPLPTH